LGPDWVDEGRRQIHFRDPEKNLVTLFRIN
jgi:hypothetical protein